MKILDYGLPKIGLTIFLALSAQSQAQFGAGTTWNAYNDFYLSPTAAGWGGATSPSALGTAWGYYAANVNGYGLPTQIGSYFTPQFSGSGSQSLYQYSNVAPIGAGTVVASSGWAATGGAGFAYYDDAGPYNWGSSLGRFDNPWFAGAPGLSQEASNLIWMQSAWLGGGTSEGIATVLTWKAPVTSAYTIAGQFISANQSANSAAIAIVDSTAGGTALLSRTVLGNNSASAFSFTISYNAGDVVQFQVGNNFSTGNAVGLQVTATAIPEPSSGLLLTAGLGALGLVRRLRRQA